MSILELFRNYVPISTEPVIGNKGNKSVLTTVTSTARATTGGNDGNKSNSDNRIFIEKCKNDIRERIEERAAIMEYDGGLTRKDAEQAAAASMRVYCYKTTEKPTIELTVIMPNTELDEAIEKLKNKYGDRLLDVYLSPYCTTYIPVNITKH